MNALALKEPGPSNLFPAPGLNRVWRWVQPGTLPGKSMVALLDPTKNLMIVDKVKFDRLLTHQQEQLMKSDQLTQFVEEVTSWSSGPPS